LAAEKEALAKDLFDMRNGSGSLQTGITSLEREMATKDELIANLRGENEILDEMRREYQAELESMANRQTLGEVVIAGAKLPAALDNELKRFAEEHSGVVEYDSARGGIKWKSDLLFALGSDVVKQSSIAALEQFTSIVKSPAASGFEVVVVGHTDNRPIKKSSTKAKHPTNWHLSAHRAISVASILMKNGYRSDGVGVMGCGEYRPTADNATKTGRGQNRRVEIYLIPTGSIVQTSSGWRVPGEALAFSRLTR
jgi:chemotaxis protein MotB